MEIKTYKVTIVYGEEDNQSQLYIKNVMAKKKN